jgi:hypothetical protein
MSDWIHGNAHRNAKACLLYSERVEAFLSEYPGISPVDYEPFFSWQSCDCCGSSYGGNKTEHAYYDHEADEVIKGFSLCEDCTEYVAYGRPNDLALMDIEADAERKSDMKTLSSKLEARGYQKVTFVRVSMLFMEAIFQGPKGKRLSVAFMDDNDRVILVRKA